MLGNKHFNFLVKSLWPTIFAMLASTSFAIQAASWQPSSGHSEIELWPGLPPKATTEAEEKLIKGENPVAGEPWYEIANVTHPTFTVYSPREKNTGTAVIVFPGGGYKILAIDLEGTEVCDWLTSKGITCVLLKYRVPDSGCHYDVKTNKHVTPKIPIALQDAQRTISTIRYNAKKYNLDPKKIGVMGFSAGGNLVVLSSTESSRRSYEPLDEIDKTSSRPDFAIPVYPGHMTMEHKNKTPREAASKELNTDIVISHDIPPTLLIHAKDDPVDPVYYSELYESELKKSGIEVTLLTYKTGGHAFGTRKTGKDTDRWTDDTIDWLKRRKFL